MKSVGQEARRDLLFLSLTAGSADAAGYVGLGHVFTSNMTGNVVLLGIDIGQGHFRPAGRIFYVFAIFMLGVCLGAWLGKNVGEKDWPQLASRLIRLEKIALILFGLGWFMMVNSIGPFFVYGLLTLLPLAMGLQSAAMNRLSAPGVGTTAVTGTLTALVTGLITLFAHVGTATLESESHRKRIEFQFRVICLYCCGAAAVGFLMLYFPYLAGSLPALAVLFVTSHPNQKELV